MKPVSQILIVLVAIEHLYILWIKMFAWTTAGRKTFKSFPAHLFEQTKALAANQGLYNGFLAAGLIWSLFITDPDWSRNIAVFFLVCVHYGIRPLNDYYSNLRSQLTSSVTIICP